MAHTRKDFAGLCKHPGFCSERGEETLQVSEPRGDRIWFKLRRIHLAGE